MRGIPANQIDWQHMNGHCIAQAKAKGFTPAQIRDAVENPYKITEVRRYPGQKRYCGRKGLAVVLDGRKAVTCYLDGIVTPMRPDQHNDPHAQRSHRLARL